MVRYHVYFGASWALLAVLITGSNFIAAQLLWFVPTIVVLKRNTHRHTLE